MNIAQTPVVRGQDPHAQISFLRPRRKPCRLLCPVGTLVRLWWRCNGQLLWEEGYIIGHRKLVGKKNWQYIVQFTHSHCRVYNDALSIDDYIDYFDEIVIYSKNADLAREVLTTWGGQ